MRTYNIGWDIGGAHIKAAALNEQGEVIAVFQRACPLWKGLEHLQNATRSILQALDGLTIHQHAVTMTGELVDLFQDRDDGVKQIIATLADLLTGANISLFAGHDGLIKLEHITPLHYPLIASANWLASALFAAQHIKNGLFVDIGSTTTDILLLQERQVAAQGYSDYQRLVSQELIYTGIVRTPVMATVKSVQDGTNTVGVMAEYFATLADVYRLTGELDEHHDQADTADGLAKTHLASAKRLARMIGCDGVENELPRWQKLADNIRQQQLLDIQNACQMQLRRQNKSQRITLVGAGIGRFLAKDIAANLQLTYLDFSSLLPHPANSLE